MDEVARERKPNIRTRIAQSSLAKRPGEMIPSRKPVYPISAERELARAYLPIAAHIRKIAKPFLERLMAIYSVWAEENLRMDARVSLQDAIGEILDEYGDAIDAGMDLKMISSQAERAAKVAKGASIRDWKALVNNALDYKIDTPFYEETLEDLVNKWTYESTRQITSYPEEYLGKIQEIISWGFTTHQPLVNVYRRIEKITGDTRSHVRMIARDQMGTLNCQMTRYEHESMGVTHYVWVTKRDNRVRECHRELNGKVFSWNNPPAMWYMTKSKGIVYTGRYCHPGEDYGCRCTANPVFEPSAVNAALARGSIRQSRGE